MNPGAPPATKWPMGPIDPLENQPIQSDVPTLLLTGLYDPITPPQYARLAGSRLTNSFYFEFLSAGHDVLSNEPCAGELAKQFLDDPHAHARPRLPRPPQAAGVPPACRLGAVRRGRGRNP